MPNVGQKYLQEASRQFVQDSSFKAPAEVVESGMKSVVEWCECLNAIRNAHGLNAENGSKFQSKHQVASQLEQVSTDQSETGQ